ncbi:MAG: class I SAM-dependent methyltransferase [Thermoplasmata archaeon]|nr:class I SAM-dependent methyltransferase [Thermoplasmata archaeon]
MTAWPPLKPRILKTVRALGDARARPNRTWLSGLLGIDRKELGRLLDEIPHLAPLERALRKAHESGGRRFYAQFRAPLELFVMTRATRPDHVIETGVSSGVSSVHFLAGLRRNRRGTLHSVDRPQVQRSESLAAGESIVSVPRGRSSGWAIPPEYLSGWDLRLGLSQDQLPRLVREVSTVDIFLHDSHHTPAHLTFELEAIRPKLHPGSVVMADNTQWTGQAFDRFARSLGARVFRRGRSDLVGLRVPEPL